MRTENVPTYSTQNFAYFEENLLETIWKNTATI